MTIFSKFRAMSPKIGLGIVVMLSFLASATFSLAQQTPPPNQTTDQARAQVPAPPARPFNPRFQGFYFNIDLGSQTHSLTSNYTTSGTGATTTSTTLTGNDSNGLAIVLDGGFTTVVVDRFMMGAGFAYETQSTDPAAYSGSIASNTVAGDKYNETSNFSIYVSPGYGYDDETLFYGKVGFAQANYLTSTLRNTNKTVSGFVVGAGAKHFLTNKIYGLVEGNYFNYKAVSATTTNSVGANLSTSTGDDNFSAYNFLFGVGFRF
ncbi:MAG: outer membrane beta-barrel protein [Alphaproteobacteria bacterium]|nr:outer membrane beta-barrel protein [Alphaproteobacteria bacterium]